MENCSSGASIFRNKPFRAGRKGGPTTTDLRGDGNLSFTMTANRFPRWTAARCRRELVDYVIPLNERHLRRVLSEYVRYYHLDRTHLALQKDTPSLRTRATLHPGSRVLSFPRLGGLHHRYDWAA